MRQFQSLPLLCLLLLPLTPVNLVASAPPPSIEAALSANGQWLVVTEQELGPSGLPMNGQKILKTSYHILRRETFFNNKDRITAPTSFWSPVWEIDAGDTHQFWPMITDDGQTVLLVGVTFRSPGEVALKLYRNESNKGRLVRSLDVEALLTDSELHPNGNGLLTFTDSSPQWFAGGTFTFSPDDQDLLFQTEWHDHLRIHLLDGAVTREHP